MEQSTGSTRFWMDRSVGVNAWMIEWMNDLNDWMNEWIDRWMTWVNGWVNEWTTVFCSVYRLGDIETNYSFEKARTVKKHADMMRNYGTQLPDSMREKWVASWAIRLQFLLFPTFIYAEKLDHIDRSLPVLGKHCEVFFHQLYRSIFTVVFTKCKRWF